MELFQEKIFPLWIILILFFIVTGIIVISYLKTKEEINNKLRYTLMFIKVMVVLMLMLALFQPYILSTRQKEKKSTIAILVDTSPTMGLVDKKDLTRLDEINIILNGGKNKFLDKLKLKFNLKIYSFSDQLNPHSAETFKQSGYSTKLVNALQNIAGAEGNENLDSILLFTDGQDSDLPNFLLHADEFEYPINPIGIGTSNQIKDIHLKEIKSGEIAYIDQDTELFVSLKNNGYSGKEVTVTLLEDDKEITHQNYLLSSDAEEKNKLKFKAKASGWHRYSLIISPQPDEKITENNFGIFYLKVIQEKIKILFIEGTPSLDFKFIKKILNEDKNLEINYLVYKNKNEFLKLDESFLSEFPTENLLHEYNAIVLSNFRYQYLTEKEVAILKDFVEKKGGGLLFLTGDNTTGYSGTELEKILPVKFPVENIFYDNNFQIALTREGSIHPITILHTNTELNAQIWKDLPELTGMRAISKIKPGATILAFNPEQKYEQGFLIVMASQEYGRGRTLLINAEGLWRWDFLMWGIGDKHAYAEKFWGNCIRWLGNKDEEKQFRIETDKRLYNVGDKINIKLLLYDKDFKPIKGANIECFIKDIEKKKEIPVEITDYENIPGVYKGEIKINTPQEATIYAKAIYNKKVIGFENLQISIVPSKEEYANLELNEKGLKKLAELTGGNYYTPDTIDGLPGKMKKNQHVGAYIEKIELWDTPWYFIIFIGLLIAEWIIRKKKGLD